MNRKSLLSLILLIAGLGACSSQQVELTDPERDPWEGFNRKVHAFNMGFDKAIFRPVAQGYDTIMPDAPQRGVRNFFRNLAFPVNLLNSLLQGKIDDAAVSTGRFMMNSTIGLLGFFDVATKVGIEEVNEDMGQTLAVWGWKDSRFLMVPFIGPYTMRDLLGRGFYGYFHPVSYVAREYNNYIPMVVDLITLRAELLPYQAELEAAADPYVLMRDVYLQNREFKIYDGDPPAPDYDSMLEEY